MLPNALRDGVRRHGKNYRRKLLRYLGSMRTVAFEHAGRREFAKLVSDHILGHEHRVENLAIVHHESVPNEVRGNHRTAGPGLNWSLGGARIHLVDFLQQMLFDKRSFFERSAHGF
jgi:hypothetical protein